MALDGIYYKGPAKLLKPLRAWIDNEASKELRYQFYRLNNYFEKRELAKLLKKSDVFIDRYVYSTSAFHSASLKRDIRLTSDFIAPKAVVYLTAPWEEIDARLAARGGRNRNENPEQMRELDMNYRKLFKDLPNVLYFANEGRSEKENVQLLVAELQRM